MIPSFKHGIIASSRPRVVAAANDVTPNAVNWADPLSYEANTGFFGYSERQITGINQTITLKVNLLSGGSIYVLVSSSAGAIGSGDGSTSQDPGFFGCTELLDQSTFTVSNNQYVTFMASSGGDTIVEVINTSDSNTMLDSFDYYCINC
jgi:hypothetical protein